MSPAMSQASVIGMDGLRGGWVAAEVDDAGQVVWHVVTDADPVVTRAEQSGAVLAVDTPVVVSQHPRRACDVAARRRLGARASTVFPAPTQATVADWRAGVDHAEAVRRARERGHPAPSRQTWNIIDKIVDVGDRLERLAAGCVVVECHPEVSFAALAGRVLERKSTAAGMAQRIEALGTWVDVLAALSALPARVPMVDALDSLACAWTAARVQAGSAEALGLAPSLIWV